MKREFYKLQFVSIMLAGVILPREKNDLERPDHLFSESKLLYETDGLPPGRLDKPLETHDQ
jgi:hypothetical protein